MGAAFAAATITLSFSFLGVTGNDLANAASAQAKSLSELLNGRSPGERTTAQLTKTKHLKRAFGLAPPDRLAGAPPLIRSSGHEEVAQLLIGSPPAIDVAPPIPGVAGEVPTLPEILGAGGGSGGGGAGGSPGGGGGPVSFPSSQPHQPVTAVAAVPEPRTWATMLLGFGLIGWRLRRRSQTMENKAAA